MLSLFGKKKIAESNVANIVVNYMFRCVENGFPDLVEIVQHTPEFEATPSINEKEMEDLLMIVLVGNLNFLPIYLEPEQEKRIRTKVLEKFALATEIEVDELLAKVKEYKEFMVRVNHPSKNMVYAMSKAFFRKYDLNDYQEDFFKSQKVPNPLIQKRLDAVMTQFIFNWEEFIDKYKIT